MKGFTLIETILVLAIFAIIFGISIPFLVSFSHRQELDGATEELISVLRQAQEKSIQGENNCSWGVEFFLFSLPQEYFLISESKTPFRDVREKYVLPKNVFLSTSQNLLKFEKLNGKIERNFEAVLTGINKRYKILINLEGMIDYY